jgi:hypothetical protein
VHSLAPGGSCQPVGYYLPRGTKVPLTHVYATDATLKIGVSSVRAVLPEELQLRCRERVSGRQPQLETTTTTTVGRRRLHIRFPDFVSSRGLLTCDDARCLTRCHRAFVSNSCHFFGTPLSIPWRHI